MFAKRLKKLRNDMGLTQRELAKKLNISYGTISMYEIGKRSPDNDQLIRFSKFFNVSTDYLLGNDNPSIPHQHKLNEELEPYIIPNTTKLTKDMVRQAVSPEYAEKLDQTDFEYARLYRSKIKDKIKVEELEEMIDFYVKMTKK